MEVTQAGAVNFQERVTLQTVIEGSLCGRYPALGQGKNGRSSHHEEEEVPENICDE